MLSKRSTQRSQVSVSEKLSKDALPLLVCLLNAFRSSTDSTDRPGVSLEPQDSFCLKVLSFYFFSRLGAYHGNQRETSQTNFPGSGGLLQICLGSKTSSRNI